MNDEQYLLRDLFHNYSKSSRPVLQRNAQVVVTFRAKLKQIIDLVRAELYFEVVLKTKNNDKMTNASGKGQLQIFFDEFLAC